jgi:hypothetical protein
VRHGCGSQHARGVTHQPAHHRAGMDSRPACLYRALPLLAYWACQLLGRQTVSQTNSLPRSAAHALQSAGRRPTEREARTRQLRQPVCKRHIRQRVTLPTGTSQQTMIMSSRFAFAHCSTIAARVKRVAAPTRAGVGAAHSARRRIWRRCAMGGNWSGGDVQPVAERWRNRKGSAITISIRVGCVAHGVAGGRCV